ILALERRDGRRDGAQVAGCLRSGTAAVQDAQLKLNLGCLRPAQRGQHEKQHSRDRIESQHDTISRDDCSLMAASSYPPCRHTAITISDVDIRTPVTPILSANFSLATAPLRVVT